MYHVSAQGVDERITNIHYYYYYYWLQDVQRRQTGTSSLAWTRYATALVTRRGLIYNGHSTLLMVTRRVVSTNRYSIASMDVGRHWLQDAYLTRMDTVRY